MKNTQKTPETISTSPNPVDDQKGSQFTSIEAIEAANQVHDAPNSRGQTNNAFPNCSATVCWAQDAIRLTKAFQLDEAGELLKISAPNLTQGAAKTVTLTLDEILQLGTESNQCISLGVIKDSPLDAAVPFTTASKLDAERKHDPRTIARTKDHLIFPNDRALYGFIDHDPDGTTFPPIEPKTLSELLRLMCEAWPECGLDQAAYIFTPSASAGVRREIDPPRDAELEYAGSGHISVAFAPGVDPTTWTQTLFAKLLEAGHGSAYITKLGQVDVRTLIDRSVAQPCRVEYTAPAVLGDGVVRDGLKREQDQWQMSGGYIEVTVAALYSDEQVRRIVDTEHERLGKLPEVQARVDATLEQVRENAEARDRATGTAPDDAARKAQELVQRLREGGNTLTLHADDPINLILDDGTAVSVSAIYSDMQAGGGQYHERGCSDPDSGQRGKARIYYQEAQQRVWIHSFAGGGRDYVIKLRETEREAKIRQLAALPTFEYESVRKAEAAAMNVRASALDEEIHRYQAQQKRAMFEARGIVDWVSELNQRYAVVNAHGKTLVMSQFYDSTFRRDVHEFQTCRAFSELYASDYVTTLDENGDLNEVPKNQWVKVPGRRTYHRLVYAPTKPPHEYQDGDMRVMNQWTGLGTGLPACSEGGTPETMLQHIMERLADGNQEYGEYITRWLAYKIQNPGSRPEVALVLRGKKGAGKGVLGRLMCRIFGRHALHIASADMLTGSFNGHLADVSFLLADEAFFPGDKSNLGRLNVLVTDETFMIHPKGITPYQGFNTLGIMMLSNELWVVPATEDERRYAVFDVRQKAQDGSDHDYFDELTYWCDEVLRPIEK